MSELSDELIGVVDDILTTYAPPDRTCFKRFITKTGNFQLIGRDVVVTSSDTELSPQPVYRKITFNDAILANNTLVRPDDYSFVLSVNAITRTELTDDGTVLVLKDASNNEEIFRLITYINPGVNLVEVAYIAVMRSIDRE